MWVIPVTKESLKKSSQTDMFNHGKVLKKKIPILRLFPTPHPHNPKTPTHPTPLTPSRAPSHRSKPGADPKPGHGTEPRSTAADWWQLVAVVFSGEANGAPKKCRQFNRIFAKNLWCHSLKANFFLSLPGLE